MSKIAKSFRRSSRALCPLLLLVFYLLAVDASATAAPPADFKMHVLLYGSDTTVRAKSTIVVHAGTSYQFLADTGTEVQIVEPRAGRVVLLDLRRRIQAEVLRAQIETGLDRLYGAIDRSVVKKGASSSRSDRVSAAMSRDLIEPAFEASFDPAASRLLLNNPSVEVTALGTKSTDQGRVDQVRGTLELLTKLTALRDPAGIPPFARLEAQRQLIDVHRLLPTEIQLLYRLAGPPRRHRWVFDYVETLTLDEREAIARIERLRPEVPVLSYERYEKLIRSEPRLR